MLRDAAEFALDDPRLADRVQQRRFAVIDVPHDRNDRRALHEILRIFFDFVFQTVLIHRNFFLDFHAVLHADQLNRFVIHRAVDRHHFTQHKQQLDDIAGIAVHLLR